MEDFHPLSTCEVYAQSTARDLPFVVASMFTDDMKQLADRLIASLNCVGMNFVVYRVPSVHRSISSRGNDNIAFCKPNVIAHVQGQFAVPVLWADADIVFRTAPTRLLDLVQDGIDFASHNWLADTDTDCYVPANFPINGVPSGKRFYCFSHSFDLFDEDQLISSGALQYFGLAARPLLAHWFDMTNQFPNVVDDQLLDWCYNTRIDKTAIRRSWLPKAYCRYAYWITTKPVIDHPQFLARGSRLRDFKIVIGHERFRVENTKLLSGESVFPRDCLIDIQHKVLLRTDPYTGVAVAVRSFTDELWIAEQ